MADKPNTVKGKCVISGIEGTLDCAAVEWLSDNMTSIPTDPDLDDMLGDATFSRSEKVHKIYTPVPKGIEISKRFPVGETLDIARFNVPIPQWLMGKWGIKAVRRCGDMLEITISRITIFERDVPKNRKRSKR